MQADLFFCFFLKQDVDVVGNDILSLVYYFFNLMPLSRGSRYSKICVFVKKKKENILVKCSNCSDVCVEKFTLNYYCHEKSII